MGSACIYFLFFIKSHHDHEFTDRTIIIMSIIENDCNHFDTLFGSMAVNLYCKI